MQAHTVKRLPVLLPLALLRALAWGEPGAQSVAAPPASAVSTPAARPDRRPLAGQELRDSARFPQDLQPEAPKPQIKVPLGRKPPPAATAGASGARDEAATATSPGGGKVNDAVARCKAQADVEAREACLRKLSPSGDRSAR